jgi:hypothetical protein
MTRLLAALALAVLIATPALAQRLPAEEIGTRIAETYGVEVLEVRTAGPRAYEVRVMHPATAGNLAFRVETLVVDARTGELVPQFRHREAGYDLSAFEDRRKTLDASGAAIRRMTFRSGN